MSRGWFGPPKFVKHPDSFAVSRAVQLSTLCDWVRRDSGIESTFLVLCHFQSTFLEIQHAFAQADIDYGVLTERVTVDELESKLEPDHPSIRLTLAAMLVEKQQRNSKQDSNSKLGVIVTERHPLMTYDDKLEQFARQLSWPVSLGYLLSFEDAIFRLLVGQKFVDLMKQLGLGRNDLISSAMSSRSIDRALRKVSITADNEVPAESPEEWIEMNVL